DLYGVTPSIVNATTISDAYFGGGHAHEKLAALERRRDGIFVAEETVLDYQLRLGDLIRIRVLDTRSHRYVPTPFHVLGVVREFPTAPTDSFLLANASYVREVTHSNSAETMLIRTAGRSPRQVARAVASIVPPGTRVQDVETERRIAASGLVAVDVGGLTEIEIVFATLIALGGVSLLLVLTFVERSRSFVILRALRVTTRQVTGLASAEAGSVLFVGLATGTAIGGTLGWILVKVLRGVFDPPPQHPVIPWLYVAALAGTLIVCSAIATAVTLRRTAHLGPAELR